MMPGLSPLWSKEEGITFKIKTYKSVEVDTLGY